MKGRTPWDSRVAWSILERLGRLDRGSNPRYPIYHFFHVFYIFTYTFLISIYHFLYTIFCSFLAFCSPSRFILFIFYFLLLIFRFLLLPSTARKIGKWKPKEIKFFKVLAFYLCPRISIRREFKNCS